MTYSVIAHIVTYWQWTLPDNYSTFLARLGGRTLGAPGQREVVLRHDWLAGSSKCSFSNCPDLCCPHCSHGGRPRSGTLGKNWEA